MLSANSPLEWVCGTYSRRGGRHEGSVVDALRLRCLLVVDPQTRPGAREVLQKNAWLKTVGRDGALVHFP